MKILVVFGTIVLALSLLSNVTAQADDAKRDNPLWLEATNMLEELDMSSLNDNAKHYWHRRFNTLAEVQVSLSEWAGQVDRGQCKENCIDLYNSRIDQWESNLQRFNKDAAATLHANKSSDTAWLKKCVDKAYADREACYLKGRDEPIEGANAWTQNCWNKSIKQEKACY